jgi:hypothetical protein
MSSFVEGFDGFFLFFFFFFFFECVGNMSDLERSKLVQKHRDALNVVEKDIKKKKVFQQQHDCWFFHTYNRLISLIVDILKGAYRDAAQRKYDELKEAQDAELAEFDAKRSGTQSSSSSSSSSSSAAATTPAASTAATTTATATTTTAATPSTAASASADAAPKRAKRFSVHNWASCGRSELDEYCKERGLSSKGKKGSTVSTNYTCTHSFVCF